MRRRRISGLLLEKAFASVRRSVGSFNAMEDDGGQTAALLHLQHAAEMLLKAGLAEKRVRLFDTRTGRSIGFEKCLALSGEHFTLTAEEAGTLRALDALRDDEQHWLGELSEELVFLHVRAVVQVLDTVIGRAFGEELANHLPDRALPVTTRPLQDFDVLVDSQFTQVRDLLAKGRRRTPEARALIRGLLAMEGHVSEVAQVSERDVNRVVKGVRAGKSVAEVVPRLRTIDAAVSGGGPSITVRFTRKSGAPVTFVSADDPTDAAAVRELDLQRKYYMSATELAAKVGLKKNKATALRRHLGIDADEDCRHEFVFGAVNHVRFSDNAYRRMKAGVDPVWLTP